VAAEADPLRLHALRNRFLRTPNVEVRRLDPEAAEDFAGLGGRFDTVLCLNVLEYVEDPGPVLDRLRGTLKAGGTLVVLVPNGPFLYGSLDRSLGHKRRYRRAQAAALLESHGFQVEKAYSLNKPGVVPWLAYSRLLGSRRISKLVLKLFDKTVWFWRRIDGLMPWPGLSLILAARKSAFPTASQSAG
jgi:SAM-dependent methyltransferase